MLIQRSVLNLTSEKWSDLIKPHVLGIVTQFEDGMNSYMSQAIKSEFSVLLLTLTNSKCVFVHTPSAASLNSLLIDCDYFKPETTKTDMMMDVANMLHEHSSSFLMTAITEKLDKAMEPEELV